MIQFCSLALPHCWSKARRNWISVDSWTSRSYQASRFESHDHYFLPLSNNCASPRGTVVQTRGRKRVRQASTPVERRIF